MGEHTYKDKRLAYESSIRVPMIISYPKLISKNTVIHEQCLNIDLAPTILELAGINKPKYMQGESMVKLMSGKKDKSWRKSIFFEYYVDDAWPYAGPDQVAVRTNEYKLVDNFLGLFFASLMALAFAFAQVFSRQLRDLDISLTNAFTGLFGFIILLILSFLIDETPFNLGSFSELSKISL